MVHVIFEGVVFGQIGQISILHSLNIFYCRQSDRDSHLLVFVEKEEYISSRLKYILSSGKGRRRLQASCILRGILARDESLQCTAWSQLTFRTVTID